MGNQQIEKEKSCFDRVPCKQQCNKILASGTAVAQHFLLSIKDCRLTVALLERALGRTETCKGNVRSKDHPNILFLFVQFQLHLGQALDQLRQEAFPGQLDPKLAGPNMDYFFFCPHEDPTGPCLTLEKRKTVPSGNYSESITRHAAACHTYHNIFFL